MIFRPAPPFRDAVPRHPRGQGLTEYLVITFLVAVGTIGVVGLFGDNLRQLFGGSSKAIAGDENADNGGSAPSKDVLQWSMKGGKGRSGNPGGATNRPGAGGGETGGGNPGGTTNSDPGGGNPGGSTNSEQRGVD